MFATWFLSLRHPHLAFCIGSLLSRAQDQATVCRAMRKMVQINDIGIRVTLSNEVD